MSPVVLIAAPVPFLGDLEGVSRGFSYVSGGIFENVRAPVIGFNDTRISWQNQNRHAWGMLKVNRILVHAII